MLLLGFSVSASTRRLSHELFAPGMILMGAGVVAYFLNLAVKPEGWIPAGEKSQIVA
jgi:hypothetical protein